MTDSRVHAVRAATGGRSFARMGASAGVPTLGGKLFPDRGKKGCTGINEDDDGGKPNKNKDKITKPECK